MLFVTCRRTIVRYRTFDDVFLGNRVLAARIMRFYMSRTRGEVDLQSYFGIGKSHISFIAR